MPSVFTRENLAQGLRQPLPALGVLLALLRGRYYVAKYRLKGVRLAVGRNFRCHGKLVIAGRGRVRIGDDCVFRNNLRHVYLGSGAADYDIEIGDRVWLHGTSISCRSAVRIGARSLVGRVEIIDHEFHDPRDLSRRAAIRARPVTLGTNTWIGNDVLILKGVEIGADSVVGARSVVRRSVEPRVVVLGNPAQVVKRL